MHGRAACVASAFFSGGTPRTAVSFRTLKKPSDPQRRPSSAAVLRGLRDPRFLSVIASTCRDSEPRTERIRLVNWRAEAPRCIVVPRGTIETARVASAIFPDAPRELQFPFGLAKNYRASLALFSHSNEATSDRDFLSGYSPGRTEKPKRRAAPPCSTARSGRRVASAFFIDRPRRTAVSFRTSRPDMKGRRLPIKATGLAEDDGDLVSADSGIGGE